MFLGLLSGLKKKMLKRRPNLPSQASEELVSHYAVGQKKLPKKLRCDDDRNF